MLVTSENWGPSSLTPAPKSSGGGLAAVIPVDGVLCWILNEPILSKGIAKLQNNQLMKEISLGRIVEGIGNISNTK